MNNLKKIVSKFFISYKNLIKKEIKINKIKGEKYEISFPDNYLEKCVVFLKKGRNKNNNKEKLDERMIEITNEQKLENDSVLILIGEPPKQRCFLVKTAKMLLLALLYFEIIKKEEEIKSIEEIQYVVPSYFREKNKKIKKIKENKEKTKEKGGKMRMTIGNMEGNVSMTIGNMGGGWWG